MIPGWVIWGSYLLIALIVWRRIAWILIDAMAWGSKPDTEDVVGGLVFGGALAAIWPATLVVWMLVLGERRYGIVTSATHGFLKAPRYRRREMELREREERIRRMEREVGIGQRPSDDYHRSPFSMTEYDWRQ